VLVHGERADVEALREEIADVLRPLGLRLSEAKTQVVHMSEGFDFLGFHLQWRRKRGTNSWHVYTFILRPARPVLEGQDSCADEQDVAAAPQGRADQAQPDHARLGQLLPARRVQAHPRPPGLLRLVASSPVAPGEAPVEVEGHPPRVDHPRRAVAAPHRGWDRVV